MGRNWSQSGQELVTKSHKNLVSIGETNGRIRLRWTYQAKRYSLNLLAYNNINLLQAKKVALQIEQDVATDNFDYSLSKYNPNKSYLKCKNLAEYFEYWTTHYRQMNCEIHVDYYSVRNMIKRWCNVNEHSILIKFNNESIAPATYNRRLTMLQKFITWLVKEQVWKFNPLADVKHKRYRRQVNAKRLPFSVEEIAQILDAFRTDKFVSKFSHVKHSHYYPFIYFMFATGCRNAEAIGLRVSSINLRDKIVLINEVLARSLRNSSSVQRKRKETKNGKSRRIPMSDELIRVLEPVLHNKSNDDLVFVSATGKAIDDDNFEQRVFYKIQKELKIPVRNLYACRHTFGSRCIDAGITPVMTAFLMGNNPETALRNYTHQITLPTDLPKV